MEDSAPLSAGDAADIAVAVPNVVHDYPAAVLLVDTTSSEIVYANDLARQIAPGVDLPMAVEEWSRAAGLQVVGGGALGASTTPLSQVALGRPAAGREISAHRGSEVAEAREALWVIGLPLHSAPEPLRRRSLLVLLPLRFPDAIADLQGAAAHDEAHRSILTSDLAVSITDPTVEDDPLVWVSDGFQRVTGYTREQALGRNCRFLQGPDTDPAVLARLRQALASGTTASETLLNYRADGTAFYNHLVITYVRDASGTVTHRVGVQTDVTQRVLGAGERAAALAEVERARGAQVAAERSGAFGQLLLVLSEALTATTTTADVAETIAVVAAQELGGATSVLALPDTTGRRLRFLGPQGSLPAAAALVVADEGGHEVSFTDDQDTLLEATVRSTEPGFYPESASVRAAHPGSGGFSATLMVGASARLPLQLHASGGLEASGATPSSSRRTGALVLTWEEPREFSAEDRAVLVALARYTAQALQRAELLAERRSAAHLLQHALLTTLPSPDHLQLRARYVPAATGEHVGGDWYDAIALPNGATALVIGDITGHDLAAAAQMGQVRGLLRAFAYDRQEPPTEIFARLESSLPALGVSALATAVLATVEPPTGPDGGWVLRWANAGHPPPLLVHPDGSTEVLVTEPDLLLGLIGLQAPTRRSDHTHPLTAGDTVLLYTDGLIEHRGRDLDHGVGELRATVARSAHLPLDDLLDVVVRDLIGDHPPDDCALIAVRLE